MVFEKYRKPAWLSPFKGSGSRALQGLETVSSFSGQKTPSIQLIEKDSYFVGVLGSILLTACFHPEQRCVYELKVYESCEQFLRNSGLSRPVLPRGPDFLYGLVRTEICHRHC